MRPTNSTQLELFTVPCYQIWAFLVVQISQNKLFRAGLLELGIRQSQLSWSWGWAWQYRRNFGHGFGLKNCSVYKIGYQLGILHFLSKKNLTWSPPTFYISTINRPSVREMTLFGKKKIGRGSPYIGSFLSGKNGLFVHLWAEQVKQQQHIFHSKIRTKGPQGHLKSPAIIIPSWLLFLISTFGFLCLGFKQLLQ